MAALHVIGRNLPMELHQNLLKTHTDTNIDSLGYMFPPDSMGLFIFKFPW